MAEWQVLFDAVSVRGIDERRVAQGPAPFGAFALAQMAPASASEEDLAFASDLETFAYRFSSFNTFRSSHGNFCLGVGLPGAKFTRFPRAGRDFPVGTFRRS